MPAGDGTAKECAVVKGEADRQTDRQTELLTRDFPSGLSLRWFFTVELDATTSSTWNRYVLHVVVFAGETE